jgi:hypothetical protein
MPNGTFDDDLAAARETASERDDALDLEAGPEPDTVVIDDPDEGAIPEPVDSDAPVGVHAAWSECTTKRYLRGKR